MTGFDNGIMMAYGMCPPCTAMEYYQMEPERMPTHVMRGTTEEVWGDNIFEVMRTTAEDSSEVQSKMIFMGHQIPSCHVPVVRSFFILWKMLLSS